ncbi:hypothetical protein BCR42DRAFT_496071 [Absidia repens]|uniref:F-box domain-containing protein n=1 Tax=Absidia repens TaxID=90262 RepID=A0A1X2I183_9FUNG|nr:hypothetical protein BCR42DRAFT_496071 [Absidia repens]
MDRFPTEIVSSIFHHLEEDHHDLFTCTLVNQWFYATVNPLLWRTIWLKCSDTEELFFDRLVAAHHPVGQHIRCINLEYTTWTDDSLSLLMTHVSDLEELWLHFTKNVSDQVIQQLLHHYPNLRLLHLGKCRLTPSTWYMLGGQLKALHLDRCQGVPPDLFASTRSLSQLEELWIDLNEIYNPLPPEEEDVDEDDNNDDEQETCWMMEDDTIADMKHVLNELTHLQVTGRFSVDVVPRLFTTHMIVVWPHLTTLILDECERLDNDTLIAFLQSHPKLHTLHLCRAPMVDTVLDTMATCLPDLSVLQLRYSRQITHHGLRRLIQRGSRRLRDVFVLNCMIFAKHFPEITMHKSWGMLGPLGAVWLKQETIRKIQLDFSRQGIIDSQQEQQQ